MQKLAFAVRILFGLSLLFVMLGFCIAVSSANNIYIGIAFYVIAMIFMLLSIIPVVKAKVLGEKQKEDRIKKLEEDIAALKDKLNIK